MAAPASADAIRDVNVRYHDAAADAYDRKWGIDFYDVGHQQVMGKFRKALGAAAEGPFEAALEVGAGTGYFSLNLLRAAVIGRVTCLDISPGMLEALERNAGQLGLDNRVSTVAADGERLPFDDASFDLVFGHAVLHHLPDLHQAFAEFRRVLKPGGALVFAGEPSRQGDRLARLPKAAATAAAPAWRRLMGAQPAPPAPAPATHEGHDGHDLESFVDVHAFDPAVLHRHAQAAGLTDVEVRGEELLANWFGWANRTLEATAVPATVPMLWRRYAYHGYVAFQAVDRALLEPRLPPAIFYNLIISARTPA